MDLHYSNQQQSEAQNDLFDQFEYRGDLDTLNAKQSQPANERKKIVASKLKNEDVQKFLDYMFDYKDEGKQISNSTNRILGFKKSQKMHQSKQVLMLLKKNQQELNQESFSQDYQTCRQQDQNYLSILQVKKIENQDVIIDEFPRKNLTPTPQTRVQIPMDDQYTRYDPYSQNQSVVQSKSQVNYQSNHLQRVQKYLKNVSEKSHREHNITDKENIGSQDNMYETRFVDIKIPKAVSMLQSNDIQGIDKAENNTSFDKNYIPITKMPFPSFGGEELNQDNTSISFIGRNSLGHSQIFDKNEQNLRALKRNSTEATQRVQRQMKMNFKLIKEDINKNKNNLKAFNLFHMIMSDNETKNDQLQENNNNQNNNSNVNEQQLGICPQNRKAMNQSKNENSRNQKGFLPIRNIPRNGFSNYLMKKKLLVQSQQQMKNNELSTVDSNESYFKDLFVVNSKNQQNNPLTIQKIGQSHRIPTLIRQRTVINTKDASISCDLPKHIDSYGNISIEADTNINDNLLSAQSNPLSSQLESNQVSSLTLNSKKMSLANLKYIRSAQINVQVQLKASQQKQNTSQIPNTQGEYSLWQMPYQINQSFQGGELQIKNKSRNKIGGSYATQYQTDSTYQQRNLKSFIPVLQKNKMLKKSSLSPINFSQQKLSKCGEITDSAGSPSPFKGPVYVNTSSQDILINVDRIERQNVILTKSQLNGIASQNLKCQSNSKRLKHGNHSTSYMPNRKQYKQQQNSDLPRSPII
ncbi:UNKNOWN [Stylonychia lemnae]|uniref:Uncharacterized protein n=1 Tax=Stylonychia lemnae TaxID=5949 RepID=A0A077ZRY1_STYLE|nr:UNKNOWN [Stylonychia lemnae]|eukprot:CDW72637.1 UNKNOWN [Stylonychia lemnae]